MSNALQVLVNRARRLFPRGWSPLIRTIAKVTPSLQRYKIKLVTGDQMYVDLRETMCHELFYFGGRPHEYGAEKLFSRLLKPGDVVVDVGANVGYYTRITSRIVGKDGVVLAVEPMPSALRILELNCADLSNVELLRVALSDREGESTFYVRKRGDASSLLSDSRAVPIRVKTKTADDLFMDRARIDFIKIDVEGFELEVLRGAQKTLGAHKPVVYFEFLDDLATERGFRLRDFETLLAQYGYTLNWVDQTMTATIVSREPTNYLVAVPNDRLHLLQDRPTEASLEERGPAR